MKQGWEYKKLGDICTIERGGSPRPISEYITEDPNGINWIKIGDAVEGSKYINSTKERIRVEGMKKSRFVHKGDFILSNSMSFGKPYILGVDGCIHDGWLVIHDDNNTFIKDYLYYYLSSPTMYRKFESLAVGGVVNNLNSQLVRNVYVSIPSIEEQKQICSLLDKMNRVIEAKKEQLKELDNLAQAIFYDMFGDPVENNKAWESKPISSIGELSRGVSKHRPRNAPELLGGTMPLIQTGDVSNSGMYIRDYSSTYSELGVLQSRVWHKGTLCITIAANIGKCSILTFDACFPDSVVGFIPYDNALVEYMYFAFSAIQNTLEENAMGVAQKNINLTILNQLVLAVPPLDKQQAFAEKVKAIERQKELINQSIKDVQTLFDAKMDYYFGD